jgi:cytochrome c6
MRKTVVAVAFSLSTLCLAGSAVAQADAGKTFQGKCVGCHAANGTGSAIGKKLGVHDFHGPDVQKESDADLADAIAKGRNKMPGYEKTLKPDDIKGLVAYIRTLGK